MLHQIYKYNICFLPLICLPLNFCVNSVNHEFGGDSSEEVYPRGFGLITELFSGTDSSKNKNLVSDVEL